MKSCRFLVFDLFLLLISINPSPLSQSVTEVKLHDAATLSCNQTCSGRVTWTVFHKQHDILAQCNQTSCRAKEGFHMSHDQYLKGDFSLTITDADYTKRDWYTCECDGRDLCDVRLRLEPPTYHISVQPGESLIMDMPVSEPVVVLFNRTSDASPQTIILCEIKGRRVQKCNPEYEKRVLFSSSLQLNEMNESDSGVYTIRDTKNDEVIATYRVSVNDPEPGLSRGVIWTLVILLILVLLLLLIGLLYGRAVWMLKF